MTRKVQLRCNAQHPGLRLVRCEEPLAHVGLHFCSWAGRRWNDPCEHLPWQIRATQDILPATVIGGRAD